MTYAAAVERHQPVAAKALPAHSNTRDEARMRQPAQRFF
jgi:hypothetical protein